GAEAVALRLQGGLHLRVIEQLAVEDDPDGLVFIGNGLPAVAEADDAQQAVGQADAVALEKAILVGAAVVECRRHRRQHVRRRSATAGQIDHPGDSTHGAILAGRSALDDAATLPRLTKPSRSLRSTEQK